MTTSQVAGFAGLLMCGIRNPDGVLAFEPRNDRWWKKVSEISHPLFYLKFSTS